MVRGAPGGGNRHPIKDSEIGNHRLRVRVLAGTSSGCAFEVTDCDLKHLGTDRNCQFQHVYRAFVASKSLELNRQFGMTPEQSALKEIDGRIAQVRGASVLLDSDLAHLYGVSVSALLQAVRRNRKRFPRDFLFQLTNQELGNLKSQSVISSLSVSHGGRRHRNWAFTEQGVAMLSSVLRSDTPERGDFNPTARAIVKQAASQFPQRGIPRRIRA